MQSTIMTALMRTYAGAVGKKQKARKGESEMTEWMGRIMCPKCSSHNIEWFDDERILCLACGYKSNWDTFPLACPNCDVPMRCLGQQYTIGGTLDGVRWACIRCEQIITTENGSEMPPEARRREQHEQG